MSVEKAITGGTVMVEDAIKHTGYADINFAPSRRCKVELIFAVPEGENGKAYMEGVTRIASTKLIELLNKTPAADTIVKTVEPVAPVKSETAAAKKKREAAEAAEAAKNAPQKTKAELAAEKGLPANDTVHKGPATDDELLAEDEPEITAAGKPVEAEDELGDLLGDTAPVPVTDTELGKAAQDKNAKMKAAHAEKWAPAKIRDLITKFAGAGKRINDIPAAERPKFLTELEALAV